MGAAAVASAAEAFVVLIVWRCFGPFRAPSTKRSNTCVVDDENFPSVDFLYCPENMTSIGQFFDFDSESVLYVNGFRMVLQFILYKLLT